MEGPVSMMLSLKVKIDKKFVDKDVINNYRQSSSFKSDFLEVKINPKFPKVLMKTQDVVEYCDTWFELLKILSTAAESLNRKKSRADNIFTQIVLKEFGGGCYGRCLEFCNLLKKHGIESRIISGFLPYPEGYEEGYFKTTMTHFIVDVLIENNWIEFDPTMKGLPTTFVRLSKLKKGLKLRKDIIINRRAIFFV